MSNERKWATLVGICDNAQNNAKLPDLEQLKINLHKWRLVRDLMRSGYAGKEKLGTVLYAATFPDKKVRLASGTCSLCARYINEHCSKCPLGTTGCEWAKYLDGNTPDCCDGVINAIRRAIARLSKQSA